ncbi:hypothetical protein [Lactococcus fujiensis]|uniref:hypothetical protein n=1 Tax=Lactococcus fujiensis TaxID=610251 RepID=UPI0006CFF2F2|nr:hypothetical protein [Lactococcus fujiensis]
MKQLSLYGKQPKVNSDLILGNISFIANYKLGANINNSLIEKLQGELLVLILKKMLIELKESVLLIHDERWKNIALFYLGINCSKRLHMIYSIFCGFGLWEIVQI